MHWLRGPHSDTDGKGGKGGTDGTDGTDGKGGKGGRKYRRAAATQVPPAPNVALPHACHKCATPP